MYVVQKSIDIPILCVSTYCGKVVNVRLSFLGREGGRAGPYLEVTYQATNSCMSRNPKFIMEILDFSVSQMAQWPENSSHLRLPSNHVF